jgi:hypothetical protein
MISPLYRYLDIVIEDMKNYDTALTYIRKLGSYEADRNLHKYSKTLLAHLPDQTTQLLIELCSGTLPPVGVMSPTPSVTNTKALSNLPFSGDSSSIFSDNSGHMAAPTSLGKLVQTKNLKLGYTPPSPRKFMPAFVDRPDCLCTFLEQVFEKLWHQESTWTSQEQEERKAIWNTLLELYLMEQMGDLTERQKQKRKRESRQKALTLLHDDSVHYDTNQALVLCQLKEFDEGIVYLYEKTAMYTDILRYWMEKGQTDRVIEGVRKYG